MRISLILIGLIVARCQAQWEHQQQYEQQQMPQGHIPDDALHAQNVQHQMNIEHGANTQQEDQKQFLGAERADMFIELTKEESIARLKELIRVIDRNQDQVITQEELQYHLDNMHKNFIMQDVAKNWKAYPEDKIKTGGIQFNDYVRQVYDPIAEKSPGGYLPPEYEKLRKRDERRWKYADLGKDGYLIMEEYACFLHPQNKDACPHMREVIAAEALDEIDKDADGYVNLEEFINFVYNPKEHNDPNDPNTEPPWVEQERQIFKWSRDKNRDGYLDLDEVKTWVVPEDFNRALMEAKHLVQMADDDKDGRLTMDEMVAHHEVFVPSKVPKMQEHHEL